MRQNFPIAGLNSATNMIRFLKWTPRPCSEKHEMPQQSFASQRNWFVAPPSIHDNKANVTSTFLPPVVYFHQVSRQSGQSIRQIRCPGSLAANGKQRIGTSTGVWGARGGWAHAARDTISSSQNKRRKSLARRLVLCDGDDSARWVSRIATMSWRSSGS